MRGARLQGARSWRRALRRALAIACVVGAAAVAAVPAADAAIPASLHDPANCSQIDPGPGPDVRKCDDGLPMSGGLVPSLTGSAAITVPAKYGGDGFTGLPPKAADAAVMPGANPLDGTVALEDDVTLPTTAPPAGGYPLLIFMHGCCGGNDGSWEATSFDDADSEKWHYSNVWFASRGYVAVNYTARGFVNNEGRGSSGETQLDSRSFEINDYQHLACQLRAATEGPGAPFDDITGNEVEIDPKNVVVTGGSYGGGFSWLALTDPKWACTADTGTTDAMEVSVVGTKYGWTDLAYTLVPNGLHSQTAGELVSSDGCDTGPTDLSGSACPGGGAPRGVPKTSIVEGLFAAGSNVSGNHLTFPPQFAAGFSCLTATYPLSPACTAVINPLLSEFMRERSAYYQNDFFARIASDPSHRVPVFDAAAFSDPLFPSYENRRMINRLLATVPGYPIQAYFGDYEHFTQDKRREWGDVCDSGDARGRHVCESSDYPGGDLDATPAGLVRTGVTTRLNRFLDHYARPTANPGEPRPAFDVTASLLVCGREGEVGADEAGQQFTAPAFEALAPSTLTIELPGEQRTLSRVPANPHALTADPVVNERTNGKRCPVTDGAAGPGIASYQSDPLPSDFTMIGSTEATVDFAVSGSSDGLQLNARLYDVAPNGTAVMVDRGTRRVTEDEASAGRVALALHGQGWRFLAGHRVRIELAQDDLPYVRSTDVPSSLALSGVVLRIPVREGSGPCAVRIRGTKRKDRIEGTSLGDRILGRKGTDRLNGKRGRDCVSGGKGRDRVAGGAQRDRVRGGKGADRLRGSRGKDVLRGGGGSDRVDARDGKRDAVDCGAGARDRATVDRRDRVKRCEKLRR